MMVVALLLRPWCSQMKSFAAKPRVLADDLQLIATGNKHCEVFEFAFNKTHIHMDDMGARLAPKKRMTFSTDGNVRNWLRVYKWRCIDATLNVVNDCRDLGAHLNISALWKKGSTLTQRMLRGIAYSKMLLYTTAPFL